MIRSPDPATRERELGRAVASAAQSGQPELLFGVLDEVFHTLIGHRLFTLLVINERTSEAQRAYTNDSENFPVGGRKQMAHTPWSEWAIVGRRGWVGRNAADIRWAYPDHELIAGLGLKSALNLPVIYDDDFLGTVNLLHEDEGFYSDADLELGAPFAALLITAFGRIAGAFS
jgi:GAF domain-containing protein